MKATTNLRYHAHLHLTVTNEETGQEAEVELVFPVVVLDSEERENFLAKVQSVNYLTYVHFKRDLDSVKQAITAAEKEVTDVPEPNDP